MAEEKALSYSPYDLQGKKNPEAIRLTFPNGIQDIADNKFFEKLHSELTTYNNNLHLELSKINDVRQIDLNDIVTSLALIFSSKEKLHHDQLSRKILLKKVLENLTVLAEKAIMARHGYFLGIGANEKSYLATKKFLGNIAGYLIETSWYEPIPKEIYLLTALKDSPEKFLQAKTLGLSLEPIQNEDQKIIDKTYADQIKKNENQFVNTVAIRLDFLKQRKDARRLRGSFINFFYDLFTNYSEKKEIKTLEVQCDLLTQTANNYKRFSTSVHTVNEQVNFINQEKTLGIISDKLKKSIPISDEDIKTLISTIKVLSIEPHLKTVEAFYATLESLGKTQLDQCSQQDFNVTILSNIFRFLAASKVSNSKHKLHNNIINQIHSHAVAFATPNDGLNFIANLKQANLNILDNTLTVELDTLTKDYQAWQTIETNSDPLFNGKLNEVEIKKLRNAVIHASRSDKITLVNTSGQQLEKKICADLILKLNLLEATDKKEIALENLFQFYTLDKFYSNEPFFEASKLKVTSLINNKLNKFTSEEHGLAYLAKIKTINTDILNKFDSKLAQNIQTKQKQFESLKLINSCWSVLLDDDQDKTLTERDINNLIGATLQLDKPNVEITNSLMKHINLLTDSQKTMLQKTASVKVSLLVQAILKDIEYIATQTPHGAKCIAIQHRLKFITAANAKYTCALSQTRDQVIAAIITESKNKQSLRELTAYIKNLESVLPEDLKSDPSLESIYQLRDTWLKNSLEDEYQKLFIKYKTELEFLKTGELSLWEKIFEKFSNTNSYALTEENLDKWRKDFVNKELISTLLTHTKQQILDATGYLPGSNEAIALNETLEATIKKDMNDIGKNAKRDLTWLTDMKAKRQLQRLDRIFNLKSESNKVINVDGFIRSYLALSAYQQYYKDDEHLADAGKEFIRSFHKIAQHQPGFITQIIAKLPLAALEAIDYTWKENPEINFKKNNHDELVAEDIVGVVNEDQNTHIQTPRYLLLNMVLELIVRDFSELLRNKPVDAELLIDRINFAIPKLVDHSKIAAKLNDNELLRKELDNIINNISHESYPTVKYQALIQNQFDDLNRETYKGIEETLLENIKNELKAQIEILKKFDVKQLENKSDLSVINQLEQLIHTLKQELIKLKNPEIQEAEHQKKIAIFEVSIAHHENQKINYRYTAYIKNQRLQLLKDTLDININNNATLPEFIKSLNNNQIELLTPKLAAFCRNVKALQTFSDELLHPSLPKNKIVIPGKTLLQTLNELKLDLNNKNKDILEIIKSIPNTIIDQMPAQTADTLKQIQYRFKDRFKQLMIQLLAKDKGQRALSIFNKLNRNTLEQMLHQISSASNADSFSISNIYKQMNIREPSKPMVISTNPNGLFSKKNQKKVVEQNCATIEDTLNHIRYG